MAMRPSGPVPGQNAVPMMIQSSDAMKAQLEEAAIVRGVQIRTNAIQFALQSINGTTFDFDELMDRSRQLEAFMNGG